MSVPNVQFAYDFLNDELETLLALSIVLMNHLEPENPSEPNERDNITAWRLSQVLNERLGSTQFSEHMRLLMFGEKVDLETTN